MQIAKEDLKHVQEMLKQLSPTAKESESIPIKEIPNHCAKILTCALNLEWFGHTGKKIPPADTSADARERSIIAVRISTMDMTFAEFVNRIREILKRLE